MFLLTLTNPPANTYSHEMMRDLDYSMWATEAAVGSLGEKHGAHAAFADPPLHSVGSDPLAGMDAGSVVGRHAVVHQLT